LQPLSGGLPWGTPYCKGYLIRIKSPVTNLLQLKGHAVSLFEAVMVVCFGISWPISIAKTLRTKVVAGKSPMFMAIVCIGYLSGVVHKLLFSRDWITILYLTNLVMVAIDLALYRKYSGRVKCVIDDEELG
jgi:hypothetical protein